MSMPLLPHFLLLLPELGIHSDSYSGKKSSHFESHGFILLTNVSALGQKEVHHRLPVGIIKIDRSRRDGTFVGFVANSFLCPGNLSLGLKGTAVVLRLLLSPTHYKAVIQLIYCFGRL